MIPRRAARFLAGASALLAACSRPAPATDGNSADAKSFLQGFEKEFKASCVDGALKQMRYVGLPEDARGARAACDCIYPRVEASPPLSSRRWAGTDWLNYKIRARKAVADYLLSPDGKMAVAECAVRGGLAPRAR